MPTEAEILFIRGLELAKDGNHSEAESLFRLSLTKNKNPSIIQNLVTSLNAQKKYDEITSLLSSKKLQKWINPATRLAQIKSLNYLGSNSTALLLTQNELKKTPNNIQFLNAHAVILKSLGEYERSEKTFNKILCLDDSDSEVRTNFSYLLLGMGKYAQAWELMESRPNIQGQLTWLPSGASALPVWDGKNNSNKNIIVHWEQGFGDTLQFMRFIPLLKENFETVHFLVQDKLSTLAANSLDGIKVIKHSQYNHQDHEAFLRLPIMSLPHRLHANTNELLKARSPYLKVCPDIIRHYRTITNHLTGPKVGLVANGSTSNEKNHLRSIRNADIHTLTKDASINWISLNPNEDRNTEIEYSSPELIRILNNGADFQDTAGLAANLDLVISVDTASVHLCGGLNVKTYLLNRKESEWRWGYPPHTKSPWYDSITIIQQNRIKDWKTPLRSLREVMQTYRQY